MDKIPPVRQGNLRPTASMIEARMGSDYASGIVDCLEAGHVHYCAADDHIVATHGEMILLLAALRGQGLLVRLTPTGARSMGTTLLGLADEAEARLRDQATDQLAAIAKGKSA